MLRQTFLISLILFTSVATGFGQKPKSYSSSDIYWMMERLQVLGNVLYVAAHPDDENTRLISYLANEEGLNTAYLSLTRGDGGQNLIGPEIQEELGIIRTQELLAARRIDGGKQFFTRAYDFGYSKTAEETMEIWNKDEVLSDMVRVIRGFKPDIIITRFPPSKYNYPTHGHHTASAILAEEAFKAAADPKAYPNMFPELTPWITERLYWNTSLWFYRRTGTELDTTDKLTLNAGSFNSLKGTSYSEIAARSRSQHKSQGFGSSGSRGDMKEWLEYVAGSKAEKSLFEGIDMSWGRLFGGEKINADIKSILKTYNINHPERSIPALVSLKDQMEKMDPHPWKTQKLIEIQEIINACAGLYIEVAANDFTFTPGQTMTLETEMINRSSANIEIKSISFPFASNDTTFNLTLRDNKKVENEFSITLPSSIPYSNPYWLNADRTKGMFSVKDESLIGMPENPMQLTMQVDMEIEGSPFKLIRPVIFKKTDPVEGEVYKPVSIIPEVAVNFEEDVIIFASSETQTIKVIVKAGADKIRGKVKISVPDGWMANPPEFSFKISHKDEEQSFGLRLTPPSSSDEGYISLVAEINGKEYKYSRTTIDYDHIPLQSIFPESKTRVIKLDLKKAGTNVGYITGAGDNIPKSLTQIGYSVTELDPEKLGDMSLDEYDAIVTGIRAFNTVPELKYYNSKLLDYVEKGGTLVIQYNTSHRLVTQDIAPYPLKLSRDRVTVEEAKVSILEPDHPIMNFPNKITDKDFENWVQERGLYFPNEWDERFTPILSCHDPGEDAREGGLLVANYGSGKFIYTGYSWFRQLPAGVPGAYRIFTNLISYGQDQQR